MRLYCGDATLAGRRRIPVLLVLAMAPGSVLAQPVDPVDPQLRDDRLQPGLYPAAPIPEAFSVPVEPGHPPMEIDWSTGLRGTLTRSSAGESFTTVLTPQASASYDGRSTDLTLDGAADIAHPWNGNPVLSGLRLGASAVTALDSVTTISASGGFELTQDLVNSPDLDPSVLEAPQIVTGSLGAGLTRQFGLFSVAASADLGRVAHGSSLNAGTGWTDNSENNYWSAGTTLRLGLQATPIFEAFAEGSAGRDMFDLASSASGERMDANDYALRAGISGEWNSLLSASASYGVGYRDFDASGIADVASHLYDASVTFRPDRTTELTARLATGITPPEVGTSGTAKVEYTAEATAAYVVNSWLRLRAGAGWSMAELTGSTETETGYSLSSGADYAVNSKTAVSADYSFRHRDNSTTGQDDIHRFSLGVLLRR
ncbi:MAG: outer membrane beta-barrel protein [Devosia sp.]|uniref:outer membrane beta-barrel protein n=1 Tax=Devosia sp. TaxID=1871048 RepID=UPI0024CD4FFA|nr:outer membrane beta-barrel protein [Devosia sp.]UYN98823.1 MAG: outer membrane beta-barrel protein [Devosia sp.]